MSRGLLLVAHGSHLDANSSAGTYAHAGALRATGRYDEVRVGFWKEEPSLSRALDPFEATDITIVPIFMSSGYFTEQVIPREMALDGPVTRRDGRTIRYAGPIGAHPSLADVIVERACEAGAMPGDALGVLGHGTPRNPNSEVNIYRQAENVASLGRFAEITTVFIDQEPLVSNIFEMTAAERVVLVPLFVADGWHVGTTIPAELGIDNGGLSSGNRSLRFAGAVGTHPGIARVVEDLVEEAATW